jgi:Sulfotransferase family
MVPAMNAAAAPGALLHPERLLDAAVAAAGSDDFGPSDFREGLEVYCSSLAGQAQLNDLGAVALPSLVTDNLSRRLRVIDWAKNHPEVTSEPIVAPIVVVGLFRAGTTLLSYLLDQDPDNRSLLGWEAADSVPPPTPDSHRAGPRAESAKAQAGMAAALNPRLDAMHHEEPDGPTECVAVMSQDFKSLLWETLANVPDYGDWLSATNQRSAYLHHRLVLQILQSGGVRGRWVLKSPHHALALEACREVYPDATFVLLHRDPSAVAASCCSIVSTLSGTFSDADHSAYLAAHWTDVLEQSLTRVDDFRAAHPEHPFIDVHYADLVRDPVGTAGAIYDRVGRTLEPHIASAMTAYVASHPQGEFGRHRYDLATLGLDAGELADRFSGYVSKYGVARESAPA